MPFNLRFMAILPCCLLLFVSCAEAEEIPMTAEYWEMRGKTAEFVTYQGQQAVYLENGLALLKERQFKNGIIEFDIAFDENRGFGSLNFRVQDSFNYENFYFRFHQAGNPDANQYTPAFNGLVGWQIYYGPQYATPVEYRYNQWMHVKVLVKDDRAEFYLDGDKPFLHIDDLLQANVAGAISFSSVFAGSYFANFSFTETDDVELIGTAVPHADWPENLITQWSVANSTFSSADLAGVTQLGEDWNKGLEWTVLPVEKNGIANLARINGRSEEADTVFVKLDIHSDRAQIKPLEYGFSDRVKIFVNGKLAAGGDDTYRARDYRFLGTVGLFNTLYLDLAEGDNEIVFAISEAFGGWAVAGRLPDREDVDVKP